MNRKYLDDLGLEDRWDNYVVESNKKLGEMHRFKEQYGVDPRETYCLDTTFYTWLYERLNTFIHFASTVVELDDVSFRSWKWEGKTYSQLGMIRMAIDLLKDYILYHVDALEYCRQHFRECTDLTDLDSDEKELQADNACEAQAEEKAHKAAEIFLMILPAMWW